MPLQMPSFTNLGDLIRRDRNLEKVAIIDLGGEQAPREFGYADLDGMANAVARALARGGFARGARIAILSANRAEFLAAYFGIMRAGFVAVPVSFKFPRREIHFILQDAGAKLVFCDQERCTDVPDNVASVQFGRGGKGGFDDFLDVGTFDSVMPQAREPAMFLYTSGSTGRPKGVVLLPQFSARSYIDAIGRYRCTWLTAVPPMIAMMLREKELLAATDLSSVEAIRMGSAPVSPALMQAIRTALPCASETNAYGTTEAGPVVFGPQPKGLPQPEMSVGYPHPQVELRLGAPDNTNAEQGVLEMRCPALMNGYHNRPQLAPPFTADGFCVTGDVFRRDDQGFHYFIGRADDMFVSGGENIYPTDA